jgi:hypothetical protein
VLVEAESISVILDMIDHIGDDDTLLLKQALNSIDKTHPRN